MNPNLDVARTKLLQAQQAVRRGERASARRWAELAVSLDPSLEEAWLILAAVGSPRASVAYLERALEINPTSQRARQGMAWAQNRLQKEHDKQQSLADTRPHPTVKVGEKRNNKVSEAATRNQIEKTTVVPPKGSMVPGKNLTRRHFSYLSFGLLFLCILAAIAFWPGNAAPVVAFLRPTKSSPVYGSARDVEKPTYTPTFTNTFTPTPTHTNTPTNTATFTPTNTPTPTDTPLPTNTPVPPPTEPPYVDVGGVHWIDVDLSQQMLYAYEGDTIVASFLVSTGVAAFPTVVGQFHIYLKFEYTLMAGDGYYLPDVPYTMYFYKGYGIHGTYWHSNFGVPMSHGCVNMFTPDAQWLFYWAPMGTLVNVHY